MADRVDINIDGTNYSIPEFAYDRSIQELIKAVNKIYSQNQTGAKKIDSQTKTLDAILKFLIDANKKTATSKSTSKADTTNQAGLVNQLTKSNELLDKISKSSNEKTDTKSKTDSSKKNNELLDKVSKSLNENSKANQGFISKLAESLGGSGGIMGGLIGKFSKFGKLLNPATAAFAGLIAGIRAAFKFLMRLGQLENTIFRRGFNEIADVTGPNSGIADGIATFAARAADASLSLDQFIELSGEFATVMGEYGTKTITDAIQNTQNLLREQGYLGLSNQELSTATLEIAEAMRILGFDLAGNNKQIGENTVRVLRTTQAFTRLTNTSNDVIKQMVLQASAIESFTNALQMLPTNLRQGALESSQTAFAGLAAFGADLGGELTTALSEGIGRGGLQFTQFGQDLARVSPALLTSLQNLSYQAGSGGNVVGALDDFRQTIGLVDNNSRQFLRALEISGDPMAKFVIKLANLNETIDDNTFAEMVKTMNEIDAGELGRAQNQMALALAKIRTAFTKVALAFLNEDTVNGFQTIVDKFTSALEGLSEWLKGPGFAMINEAFTGITNFISDLVGGKMTLWEGLVKAFGGVFSGLYDIIARGISSGIARGVAKAIPGGVNEKMIDKMDSLAKAYREAEPDKKEEALNKLYDYVFNTTTTPGGMEIKHKFVADDETIKLQDKLDALSNYRYGVDLTGTTTGATTQNSVGGTQQTDSMTKPESNIKIMPMFGSSEDYLNKQKSADDIKIELLKGIKDACIAGTINTEDLKGLVKKANNIQENWNFENSTTYP